jgi:hypothetical protein
VVLPRSATLSLWSAAVARGAAGPDDLADAVRGDDPRHLVVDWPDTGGPVSLAELPGLVRRAGAVLALCAAPAPGDPAGLAGPAAFNQAALDAGEAVVFGGAPGTPAIGLVPELDARTVLWRAHRVASPPTADPGEASRTLRRTLLSTTETLVDLDVASWQPEIPDLLMNLRDREPLDLPPDTPAALVEGLERAVLCREIVALALEDHGGSTTAAAMAARRGCLTDLDRAARRAFVALCSDSLGTT